MKWQVVSEKGKTADCQMLYQWWANEYLRILSHHYSNCGYDHKAAGHKRQQNAVDFTSCLAHAEGTYLQSTQKVLRRAVQDYDLYLIRYDYFELLWLYYDTPHILSSLTTVEYDTIWLRIQYDMVVVFNHNNNIHKCHRSAQFWCRSDLYVPYLVM